MGMLSKFDLGLQPRVWFTLDYWRLEDLRASCATHGGWSNEDVDVVAKDKRNWREIDYLWLWLADGANVGTMFVSIRFVFHPFLPSPISAWACSKGLNGSPAVEALPLSLARLGFNNERR